MLIGESTERLVRELVTLAPFGVLALKSRSETVTAYRVVSLERPAGVSATAFVGREDELRRFAAVPFRHRRCETSLPTALPGIDSCSAKWREILDWLPGPSREPPGLIA